MSKTFSESWHRVAHARLSLLPAVVVQKQTFRGREWYVLRDAYTHRFFRITKQAYTFVSRLDGRRTVEEAWEGCLAQMPSEAPGQEEVMQLLLLLARARGEEMMQLMLLLLLAGSMEMIQLMQLMGSVEVMQLVGSRERKLIW